MQKNKQMDSTGRKAGILWFGQELISGRTASGL